MPENAARKKRAHLLSKATGAPYTASLNILAKRPDLAQHILWPGDWLQRIGRPVAVISAPTFPGPRVQGCSAHDNQLYEIRLSYGPISRPEAQISTTYPLADNIHPESQLRMKLAAFASRHPTPQTTPQAQRDHFNHQLQALETAPLEPSEVMLCTLPTPALRLRLAGFEALEIHHDDAIILYCARTQTPSSPHFLHLDLNRPRPTPASHPRTPPISARIIE